MTIRGITADMDQEDRNVANNQNALEWYSRGVIPAARVCVAADTGFTGTFAEWEDWASATLGRREAQRKANESLGTFD